MQIGAMQVGIGQQRAAEVGGVQIAAMQIGPFARFPSRPDPLPMTVEDGAEPFGRAFRRPDLAAAVPFNSSFCARKASVHVPLTPPFRPCSMSISAPAVAGFQ